MENTKPFYESKTFLGLVPWLAVLLNRWLDAWVSEMELVQILETLAILVSMIMMAYGRYKATHKLTLLPKKK